MTKLLCATDLLPKSEAAIERAALLAEGLGAKLSLLHVVSPFAPQQVLERTLRTAIERMRSRVRPPAWHAKLKASAGVLVGNPRRLIVGSLAREHADLLVIGPHRNKGGVAESIQDTIAERAVSARRCPVLIVRQAASGTYRKVLVALDLDAESAYALRTAERLGLTHSDRAAVVHAYAAPRFGPVSAGTAMSEFLRRHSAYPDRYEVVVVAGRPAPTLVREIEHYQPDLFVMGSRGHGRIGRIVAGSVANQILQQVRCDILIAPKGGLSAQDSRDLSRWEGEGGRLGEHVLH